MPIKPRPLALIILDGWGYRKEEEANAIAAAHTPHWDTFLNRYPYTLISGSGRCVGLPEGQMGNSEVGHLNMGAGRIVNQDLTQIEDDIATGKFFKNAVLLSAIDRAVENKKAIHILGLLSPGGVHSHEKQIHALLTLAAQQGADKVYIHVFLDGRDTPPRSAHQSLENLIEHCQAIKCGKIVSMIGRYYAMDRDKRWDRVQLAYDLLTMGLADYHVSDALTGLQLAYGFGDSDEFIKPTSIHPPNQHPVTIEEGDTVIFMNFRADRARELTQAFIENDFLGFKRRLHPHLAEFITLTEYDANYPVSVVYPPLNLTHMLGEYLSELGLRQLRIAETEKYAHVTFFFNGGIEKAYPGEERILVPSSKVATYDLHPEMSAYEITEQLIKEIEQQKYDVIICNFANPDMVGHTGHFEATVKAVETIDNCLGKIVKALQSVGGEAIITADHGNAECMFDETTGQAHTAHTSDPVPFVYIGREAIISEAHGALSDVAPTMLYIMKLPKPAEMTGKSLIHFSPIKD